MRREKLKRTNRAARVPMQELGRTDPDEHGGPGNGVGAKGSDQGVVALETTGNRMPSTGATNKPFGSEKRQVYEASKAVKSQRGAAGVDGLLSEVRGGSRG